MAISLVLDWPITRLPVGFPMSGIHGNFHYLMLEKNSTQIAAIIANWLTKKVTRRDTLSRT
jgi:hypothetical protein